jgi:threonine-phosphate decarboxylase
VDIKKFVNREVRDSRKAFHGGDVWSVFAGDRVRKVLDFSSNVNPFGPSKKALKAIRDSLWKISYYPDTELDELRQVLGEYLGVSGGNLIVGNGSTEIIKIFCDLFIKKGDEVIVPEPTFSEYEMLCRMRGAKLKFVYASSDRDFEPPYAGIVDRINGRTRAVFLCSPNNPTGKVIEGDMLEEIAATAEKYGCFVFLDEAYIEFTDRSGMSKKAAESDNLLVLRSMTKFFSLPGLRVGYAVACKDLIEILEKGRIPWNVNVLAQAAAIASLKDSDFIRKSRSRVRRERDFLRRGIEKLGIRVFDSEANFLLLDLHDLKVKARDLRSQLIRENILIRDCSSFRGLDEYFARISCRKRSENKILLARLKEILEAEVGAG